MSIPIYTSEKVLPYVYYGVHKETGQFYIGSRANKRTQKLPSHLDLGTRYFTSSKIVKNLGFENFNWTILAEFVGEEANVEAYWFEQDLIKENWQNPLNLNGTFRNRETSEAMFSNIGKTKETDKGLANASSKQKQNSEKKYNNVVELAEKLVDEIEVCSIVVEAPKRIRKNKTGQTKETHPGRMAHSQKMTGRNKENDPGMALISQKMSGRNKENDAGCAKRSAIMSARTKENDPGRAAGAEKHSKLNPEQRALLVKLRDNGATFHAIHRYFVEECGIKVSGSVIPRTYYRETKIETSSSLMF